MKKKKDVDVQRFIFGDVLCNRSLQNSISCTCSTLACSKEGTMEKNDRPILHASVTFGFNDEPANKLSRRRQLPVGRGRITDRYVGTVR